MAQLGIPIHILGSYDLNAFSGFEIYVTDLARHPFAAAITEAVRRH
jgi:hypothetical protein